MHHRESNIFTRRQSSGRGGYYRKVEGLRERLTLDTETPMLLFHFHLPEHRASLFPTQTGEGRFLSRKLTHSREKGHKNGHLRFPCHTGSLEGTILSSFPCFNEAHYLTNTTHVHRYSQTSILLLYYFF